MDDQTPFRIGMLDDSLPIIALHHLQRQKVGKNRQRFVQRTALVMAFNQPYGLSNISPLYFKGL
jgi:hypothetical protein